MADRHYQPRSERRCERNENQRTILTAVVGIALTITIARYSGFDFKMNSRRILTIEPALDVDNPGTFSCGQCRGLCEPVKGGDDDGTFTCGKFNPNEQCKSFCVWSKTGDICEAKKCESHVIDKNKRLCEIVNNRQKHNTTVLCKKLCHNVALMCTAKEQGQSDQAVKNLMGPVKSPNDCCE